MRQRMVKIAVLKCPECGYVAEEELPLEMHEMFCPKCKGDYEPFESPLVPLEIVDFKEKT